MKIFGYLVLTVIMLVLLLSFRPESPSREELVRVNQEQSIEILKLKAQLSTYEEEGCDLK